MSQSEFSSSELPFVASILNSYFTKMKATAVVLVCCLLLGVVSVNSIEIGPEYIELNKNEFAKCTNSEVPADGSIMGLKDKIKAQTDDHEMGCTLLCVMKEVNIMKDSKIDGNAAKEMIKTVHSHHPEKVEQLSKIADDCLAKTHDIQDQCDMAFNYVKCYMDEMKA